MFNKFEITRTVTAFVGAVFFSTVFIGATVAPATQTATTVAQTV